MEQKAIRANLAERRLRLGISRADLAGCIGVREATLYRWERGGIANIPQRSLSDWLRAIHEAEAKTANAGYKRETA